MPFRDPIARRRYVASLLMILSMVGVAEWLDEREVIFPEMAALCIGLWIVDKRVWQINRSRLVGLLTCGAFIGIGIVRFVPLPLLLQLGLAFSAAALLLFFSRTTLIPLLSAVMLPVLLHTESLVYPLSVGAMSLIIAIGHHSMERHGWRRTQPFTPPQRMTRSELRRWGILLLCVMLIASLPLSFGWKFCVLPPLVVVFTEFATSKAGFRNRPVETWLTLNFSVCMGSVLQLLLHHYWGVSEVVVGAIGLTILFLLFERRGRCFAPAGALVLIPMIVPQEALYLLPLQVSLGAFTFIATAMLLFQRCYRWPRAQLMVSFIPDTWRHLLRRPEKVKN